MPVFGALGIFLLEEQIRRGERIRRSRRTILREVRETKDSLLEEEKRIRYYVDEPKLSPITIRRRVDYRNAYVITDAFDSVLHSGLFTYFAEYIQYVLSNLYSRIKTHNTLITSMNQFEEKREKMLEYQLYLTDLEIDIMRLIYESELRL